MHRDMKKWAQGIIDSNIRRAIPIMTYPGLNVTGRGILEMVTNGHVQYECIRALAYRYPVAASSTMVMALYVEAEAFGCEVRFSNDEIPSVSKRLITSFDELEIINIPEVGASKTGEHLLAAKLTAENLLGNPVFGGTIGPFSLAVQLYGMTEMMMAILIDPEGSHRLLRMCTEFIKKYTMAYRDTGSNGVIMAEPAAGLLAEKECDEFSSCYVKEIVDYVQDESFIVILHNCGNTKNLVRSMVSTGSAAFHFGNAVSMTDILPQVPSDRLVMGNIDPAGILKNGSPQVVRERTLELLNNTSGFSNFILSSGCDIPPGTDLRNIDEFFNALGEYNNRNKY